MSEPTYISYEPKNFGEDKLRVIHVANQVIGTYEADGLTLTVRQLYYRLIALDLIPDTWVSPAWNVAHGLDPNSKNNVRTYKLLAGLLNEGRMAGLVSWTSLEDRARNLKGLKYYSSPARAIREVRENFRLDKWARQEWRPEVWVEKEAMEGVLADICNRVQVDFFATKGYNSQSEQWRAGRRFADRVRRGQRPIVFHLADHDPSGIHMTRDIRERLELFAGVPVTVSRIALNMDQIRRYDPPPNPAKESDSRFARYQEEFGDQSWELDALDPRVIMGVIEDAVSRVRDPVLWDEAVAEEAEDLRLFDSMIDELAGSAVEDEDNE